MVPLCIIVTLFCICLCLFFVVIVSSVSFFSFLSPFSALVEFVNLVARNWIGKEKNYGIEMGEKNESREIL